MVSLKDTQTIAETLLEAHGLAQQGWRFVFDNAKTRGGQCRHHDQVISMSRNLVTLWTEDQVREVMIHEIAHALVGPGQGHGRVWAAKMRELGAVPSSTHNFETVRGRYAAYCDSCDRVVHHAHRLTSAMRAGRHLHSTCRTPVRWVDTELALA